MHPRHQKTFAPEYHSSRAPAKMSQSLPHNQKLAVSPVISFLKVVKIVLDYNYQQNLGAERRPAADEPLNFKAELVTNQVEIE
jgi:hypothetical protein